MRCGIKFVFNENRSLIVVFDNQKVQETYRNLVSRVEHCILGMIGAATIFENFKRILFENDRLIGSTRHS